MQVVITFEVNDFINGCRRAGEGRGGERGGGMDNIAC